jgi:hypothetical protein
VGISVEDVKTHGIADVVGDAEPVTREFSCIRKFALWIVKVNRFVESEL